MSNEIVSEIKFVHVTRVEQLPEHFEAYSRMITSGIPISISRAKHCFATWNQMIRENGKPEVHKIYYVKKWSINCFLLDTGKLRNDLTNTDEIFRIGLIELLRGNISPDEFNKLTSSHPKENEK
jgi:hypothetical protein